MRKQEPTIKVVRITRVIDGVKWRLLPKAVVCDGTGPDHRHWIPESKVQWKILSS